MLTLKIKDFNPVSLTREAERLRNIWPKAYAEAVGSAMKRALDSAKTQARRDVAAAARVPQKAIKGRVAGSRVRGSNSVRMWYTWKMLPAEAFSKPRQTSSGVRAGSHTFPGAFITAQRRGRKSGNDSVFARVGKERGPIKRQSIDISQHKELFITAAKRGFFATYEKRLIHEMNRRLKSAGLG